MATALSGILGPVRGVIGNFLIRRLKSGQYVFVPRARVDRASFSQLEMRRRFTLSMHLISKMYLPIIRSMRDYYGVGPQVCSEACRYALTHWSTWYGTTDFYIASYYLDRRLVGGPSGVYGDPRLFFEWPYFPWVQIPAGWWIRWYIATRDLRRVWYDDGSCFGPSGIVPVPGLLLAGTDYFVGCALAGPQEEGQQFCPRWYCMFNFQAGIE